MPQYIKPEALEQAENVNIQEEMVPALAGASQYFAYATVSDGTKRLCILDKGQWRLATINELMTMVQGG